jgi:hypothetical protein
MGAYAQEVIPIISESQSHSLHQSIWWYSGVENDNIYAEITVEFQDILFVVDGSNPYAKHCQYGLQFVEYAGNGDVIKLENMGEIIGFRAIKRTGNNAQISIIYYKQ